MAEPKTSLALAPQPEAAHLRLPPHNIEAEQALLGAVMVNNEAYNRVADFLLVEHFYEPVHAKIFEVCAQLIGQGQLADPVTLRTWFNEDPALRELDGAKYLRDMAIAAETIINAEAYARLIHDLALRRGLIRIGEDVVTTAYDPQADEGAQVQIEHAEQRLYTLAQEGLADSGYRTFPIVLTRTIAMVESAYRQDGKITGVPTGLADMDDKLGGLQPSDLIILAGRPSMGKTALAVTIGANAAASAALGPAAHACRTETYAVGLFSLEMSAEQLAMRLLAAEANLGSDDLRRGKLKENDFHRVVAASQRLAARPLFIDDTPALSIAALRTRARRLMRREGMALLVVDYLQLLRGTSRQSEGSRVQEIGEITQGLKAIAKELNIPVLALSQLSRAVEQREDKRPQLADLRESGSIEQDADVVMFVYRDEYYLERAEPKQRPEENADRFRERYEGWSKRYAESRNLADVLIAKQRNGPIGSVRLSFDGARARFANAEFRDYDAY
jgi:replicative DNA helicase